MMNVSEETKLLGSSFNNGNGKQQNSSYQTWYLYNTTTGWLKQFISDKDAIQFGTRMSVCLTVSSLFVLVQLPNSDDNFPEGMWVLITVLFVCWFPQGDAASVIEKSGQRIAGTLIGAFFGVSCGFISLHVQRIYGQRAQSIFLLICIAVISFVTCSYAMTTRVGGGVRLIEKKNYATILCLLTFTICVMPFYSIQEHAFKRALIRISNVLIGCILGVGMSMLVFPKPSVNILVDNISKQIILSGESSQFVLYTAADIFADNVYVSSKAGLCEQDRMKSIRQRTPSERRFWRSSSSNLGEDSVLEKYDDAMKLYRTSKAQLGKLQYDPFNLGQSNNLLESFRTEVAHTLTRSMRIQTTIVLIGE
jgi:hypothetical protein